MAAGSPRRRRSVSSGPRIDRRRALTLLTALGTVAANAGPTPGPLGAILGARPARGQTPLSVVVARQSELADDPRDAHVIAVLRAALDASGQPYSFAFAGVVMEQRRVIEELRIGRTVTLMTAGMSNELEATLLPIRFPLTGGLIGHRVALVKRARLAEFARVRTLDDLRTLRAGQGIGWPDVQILRAGGLPVQESRYDTLFLQVVAGRIDYFPRGINEVFGEVAARAAQLPELAIEPTFALVYPFDVIYYVHPDNVALASALRRGLEAIHADGRFERIFQASPLIRQALDEGRLAQRHRIDLANPLLTPDSAAAMARFARRTIG